MNTSFYAIIAAIGLVTGASADGVTSITAIEFGPENVLFLGDGEAGVVHAMETVTNENPAKGMAYNLNEFDFIFADVLGTTPDNIRVKDLAIHPESGEAYVAVSRITGDGYEPALVIVNQAGIARLADLSTEMQTLTLPGALTEDFLFFGNVSARSLTITDILFHGSQLFVSGLSNADFASTLWTSQYPFATDASARSVEIYHAVHGQNETRAPIRTMAVANLNGTDHLIAAYTCTPLVAIPLEQIVTGEHITGITVGDMGYGNTPIDLLAFTGADMQQNQFPALFLSNKNKNAQVVAVPALAAVAASGGLTEPLGFEGSDLGAFNAPIAGILQAADQDAYHIATIRRDLENGDLELMSFQKNLYFRLSDFESEYEFPGYVYPEGSDFVLALQNQMKQDEGYPQLTR